MSQELSFPPKKAKTLNKYEILKNILPLYDTIGISKREKAFRGYAETYNVQVA